MLFISKRIVNFGEQTPTAVEHTSTPVNSRSTPVETSPPPISKDDRSEKLVELVVKTAIKTKGSALFSGKIKGRDWTGDKRHEPNGGRSNLCHRSLCKKDGQVSAAKRGKLHCRES
jgi:hypothetical protein